MARGFGKKNEPTPDSGGKGPQVIMPDGSSKRSGNPDEALRSLRTRLDTLTGTVSDLVKLVGGEIEEATGTAPAGAHTSVLDPEVRDVARSLVLAERTAVEVTATARAEAHELTTSAQAEAADLRATARAEAADIVDRATRRAADLIAQAERTAAQRIADRDAVSVAERLAWEERRKAIESMLKDLDTRIEGSRTSLDTIASLVRMSMDEPMMTPGPAPTAAPVPAAPSYESSPSGRGKDAADAPVARKDEGIELRDTLDLTKSSASAKNGGVDRGSAGARSAAGSAPRRTTGTSPDAAAG